MFSKSLKIMLNFVLDEAKRKRHEIMTVEHLLLALMQNREVIEILMACDVNLEELRDKLNQFIDKVSHDVFLDAESKIQHQPSAAFQRVLQRAVFQAQSVGKLEVTGVNVLAAIMSEEESQAARFLGDVKVRRSDIINYISKSISRPASYGEDETDTTNHMNPSEIDPEMLPLETEGILERYAVNLNEQARMGKIRSLFAPESAIKGEAGLGSRNNLLNAIHENLQSQGHLDISDLLREGQRDYRRYMNFRKYPRLLAGAAAVHSAPKNALTDLIKQLWHA